MLTPQPIGPLFRGDDYRIGFTLTLTDENGEEHNLAETGYTDYQIRFTVKEQRSDSDSDAIITKTSASGQIIITDAASNKGYVRLQPADSSAFTSDKTMWYDLQVKTTAMGVKTAGLGEITFTMDISRTA